MATPPHAARNAPSGPRKPHMRTEQSRSGDSRLRVVLRIRYAHEIPARIPQNWMQRWAGVQKVSRPMERCQEMSQCTPAMAQVTAATEHHTYQGVVTRSSGTETAIVVEAK